MTRGRGSYRGRGRQLVRKCLELLGITKGQRVAVLVDGNNVERGMRDATHGRKDRLDLVGVVDRVLAGRTLQSFHYYREGFVIDEPGILQAVTALGGKAHACGKGADVPLSMGAVRAACKADVVVVVSGDADYVELARYLKGVGVRFEIAAVEGTISELLLDEAEHLHLLDGNDASVFTGPRRER